LYAEVASVVIDVDDLIPRAVADRVVAATGPASTSQDGPRPKEDSP
jgi:hypothetical protein